MSEQQTIIKLIIENMDHEKRIIKLEDDIRKIKNIIKYNHKIINQTAIKIADSFKVDRRIGK